MTESTLNQVTSQAYARHRRKRWQILVSVLASVVVFVTTYLLILPAITKETKTYCGFEEHIHTDECYSCYENNSETGLPAEHTHDECEFICGFETHEHTEMCYINLHSVVIKMSYDSREVKGDIIDNDVDDNSSEAKDKKTAEEAVNNEETTENSDKDSTSEPVTKEIETKKDEAEETETKESETKDSESKESESKENKEKEENEYIVVWERHLSVKDGDALMRYLEDISTLPNGFEPMDATWYNAENDKEFSLTEAVSKDLELYADFNEVAEDKKEEETTAESETTTEAPTTTEPQTTTTTKPDNILKLADTFTYENKEFIVNLDVKGNVKLPDGQKANSDEKIKLAVELADKNDESYNALAEYAQETRNPVDVVAMQVMKYSLLRDGQELDLSDCKVKAEIKPTPSLLSGIGDLVEKENKDGNSQIAAAISAYEMADDEINELDSIYPYDEDEEGDALEFSVQSDTIALYSSTTANPHFKVEYKAFIDTLATSGDVGLNIIIDTSAKANGGTPKLPQNKVTPKTKNIFINYLSNKTHGIIAMNEHYNSSGQMINGSWTDVFASEEFEYIKAPSINYFNKFYAENNYELVQVKISHNGVWHAFVGDLSKLHFTNRTQTATDLSQFNTWISFGGKGKNNSTSTTFSDVNTDIYVIIDDTTTIQLAAKPTNDIYNNAATFYDYDISDGYIYSTYPDCVGRKNKKNTSTQTNNTLYYANAYKYGINSDDNYHSNGVKLAFGNVNTGTAYGDNNWNGNNLNKANFAAKSYQYCTYGLASHLDTNGNIVYSSGVSAPNLFNEGPAIGKEVYDNYSLDFTRTGDTYTLFAVNGAGGCANNLNRFNNPTCSSTTYKHIWTNNFWPMDSAPSFGSDGHDLKFGDYRYHEKRGIYKTDTTTAFFPNSDDGLDHNSYFGMHFAVDFTLTEDYIGPLEYTFFGDDDMWVFLDGKLVCDIGGVHSTVGEYVDLWDYIKKGDAGTHELSFFYTERGASGSSCFMQFTLPSVASATPEQDTGELRIEKEITGPLKTQFEFVFDINFTDADGNHLHDDYSYSRYSKDGELLETDVIIWNGGTFRLRNGEYIIVKYLPDGTKYTVTEHSYDDYKTSIYLVNDGEIVPGSTATGSIDISKKKQLEVRIINELDIWLPATGGSGTTNYILGGSLLIAAAMIYGYRLRNKRKKEDKIKAPL